MRHADDKTLDHNEVDRYESGLDGRELFDWSLLGAYIRNKRRRAGYSKAAQFERAIYNRTRYRLKAATLYKIESGEQPPSIEQLFAILAALGIPWGDSWAAMLAPCACDEWRGVNDSGEVPDEWRAENLAHLRAEAYGPDPGEWPRDRTTEAIMEDAAKAGAHVDKRDAYITMAVDEI